MAKPLAPMQALFVREYIVDLNATQAAIRAGYSERTARIQAVRLLANINIAAAIQEAQRARAERTEITADMVLKRWWDLATADPNELMQFRRVACPDCHAGSVSDEPLAPDREPDHDCQKCRGEGVNRPFFHDTRRLKGGARLLYAGVKVTREGIEVKTHDQAKALENVARHLGMFIDRSEVKSTISFEDAISELPSDSE